MLRVFSVVVALVVSVTLVAAPASAQDQWTTPRRLPTSQATIVNVTSSGSGHIFSTYGAGGVLEVSRRPGGRWIRGRDPVSYDPQGVGRGAVIDDDGNVTVAYPTGGYCPSDGGDDEWDNEPVDFRIEAKFRPYRSEDWRLLRVPGQWDGCTQSFPALDVDARGTVTAVWSGNDSLYAAQRRLGQRWSKPVLIGRSAGSEFDVEVTGDKVTAVWAAGSVRSATSHTFGRWGRARKVAAIPGDPYGRAEHLSLVGTGRGSLLAAWSDFAVNDRGWYSRVRFSTADRRGAWRAPRTVDRIDVVPTRVQAVVVAAHGRRTVLAWHMRNDSEGAEGPLKARVRAGGRWSSTKLLDRRADVFGPNGAAANDAGATLVWTGGDAGNYFPVARTRPWAGAWGASQLVAGEGTPGDQVTGAAPWVVAWKPDVFTAAFGRIPQYREVWSADLPMAGGR